MPAVACGIDWAEGHHDVAIVDELGVTVLSERITNDAAGLTRLLEILDLYDPELARLPVAIETSRGLLVTGLRAAGRTVFAVNPLAVSRYRDRYRSSRGKSDAFDGWCWPTSCAPTATRTGRCRPTAIGFVRCRF
jgi:transposase